MVLCLLVEAIVSTYATEQEAQLQAFGFEINDLVRREVKLRLLNMLLLIIYGNVVCGTGRKLPQRAKRSSMRIDARL
jgi:hypothetical protein